MTVDLMTAMSSPRSAPDAVAMVGPAPCATGSMWCSLTHGQLQTATDAMVETLTRLGLRAGDVVAVVSRYSQAVQFVPLELAARRLGVVTCHVEATRFDAHRLTLYFAHFPIKAVIGLTEEVVDNLGVELHQLLGDDAIVIAEGSLSARLRQSGVDSLGMVPAGPVLSMECLAHDGLHLDTSVWKFFEQAGRVFVDGPGEEPIDTGLRGSLQTGECRCGSTQPRLIIDAGDR